MEAEKITTEVQNETTEGEGVSLRENLVTVGSNIITNNYK